MTDDTYEDDWADGLIELLDHQRHIYYELRELSERQAELVAAGEAASLLNILSQRQQLIEQLAQISGRIEPFRRDWPTAWGTLDADTQTRVQALINHVHELLDSIVTQDGRDRASLRGDEAGAANDTTSRTPGAGD
ncbi:MAG: hypothetical protein GC159_09430 [Phycisphaera sp.]|nr:hypothetical protein [Phycisphaera sp.]